MYSEAPVFSNAKDIGSIAAINTILVTLDYKAPVAAAIMVLMVAMMVFDFIPVAPVTAVMIAGILMVLTGCFRNVEAAYKTINWESIVLPL